ncbi:MAG: NAD-dependent deacylase [Pseudomonadota bacterium]|nr:NAD-dependent deacylase [Pseudomonadota bacterium]MDQ8001407.1 NAD-dependent deacylase [Pseudomonadota bacterium]
MSGEPAPLPPGLLAGARAARRVVVLTGAGMSSESGIPTFRDKVSGLWARWRPEDLATPDAFARQPAVVWAWYEARRRQVARAQPNAGHRALRELAALPQVQALAVVTQNVDDLHERAGSTEVLHLHGSLFAPRCFDCAHPFALPADERADAPEAASLPPPRCTRCGGPVRPGVVWFGEALPEAPWRAALARVAVADLVLVVGTSGLVYPAASLPDTARQHGAQVVILNPDADARGAPGDIVWQTTAAAGLPALVAALRAG